ncbi:hypothetical protein QNN00_16185 [Bacillus velezensis]|nr:hypothetical protein [Bacillus velezensis]
MDGWCFGIVMKEFLMIYQSLGDGRLSVSRACSAIWKVY